MKILLFSARYSGSGSPIRAGLIAKGLKLAGAEVAVAGYSIPDDLQNLVKAYVFQSDRSGGDYLVEAALDFKPDWIYGITDDQAAWVINASRQAKCKAAFDLHGIGAFEAIDLGKAYSNRMRRIRQSLTNLRNVGKAQFMTTCTPNMYKLARILWGGARVADFTGMVDSATFLNNLQERPAPVSTGEKVNVFYIGNYYRWQGVGILLDAIKIVKSQCDRFEFSILGSAGKDQAPELTNHSAIRDGMVTILDSVPHAEVPRYMNAADILVIPRPSMLSAYFGFPSKLCEYMAAGKLIIATDISPHRWALENPRSGMLCKPNAMSLARAIMDYDPSTARQLGQTAQEQALRRFDYQKQCRLMLQAFEKRL